MAGADVVHFHNPSLLGGPGALGLPDALRVYTTHEHWLLCPTHVLFRYGREVCTERTCWRCTIAHRRPPQLWRSTGMLPRALAQLDLVLSPSRFTAGLHREAFPELPIEVLPLPAPDPASLRALPPPTTRARPYVLFAGRLEPVKGALRLARAFAAIDEVDLLVVGDGSEAAAVGAIARNNPRVELLGKRSHAGTLALCRDALAVVVPSAGYESFGGVAVEAMALGTPALVRDLGALPELLEHGGGLTFGDDHDMVDAIRRIAGDAALARRLGEEAAAAYEPVRSERTFFRRYFELLAASAKARGRSRVADAALEEAAR
jgi:glycosyltransferase involved in cell wall biosynthesis